MAFSHTHTHTHTHTHRHTYIHTSIYTYILICNIMIMEGGIYMYRVRIIFSEVMYKNVVCNFKEI